MEAALSSLSPYLLLQSGVFLIHTVLWSAVIILLYLFKKRNYANASDHWVPAVKQHFYKPFGILNYFPSYATMKKMSLPPSAYFTQAIMAAAVEYPENKLLRVSVLFQDWIFLLKPESVEEFLTSKVPMKRPWTNVFVSWFGNGLFTSYGSKWKARKKLFGPVFRSDVFNVFVPKFDKQSKVLVEILKSRHHEESVDILDLVALCSMMIAFDTILGIDSVTHRERKTEIVEAMRRTTQAVIERITNPIYQFDVIFRLSAMGRHFKKDISYLHSFAEQVILQRKEDHKLKMTENGENCSEKNNTGKKDFIDLLLNVHISNPSLTIQDIRAEVVGMIYASQDSTSSALAWSLYLIGLHPEIQSKIHEELDRIFQGDQESSVTADDLKEMCYLECTLKESQRLYPSVPFNPKEALEDFDLCGYKVRKGSIIMISLCQLHRNPEAFPDPEKFDPDRFLPENSAGRNPFAYIPFSAGPRTCVGYHFAMMEVKTVISNVLRNFSIESLEQRDKIVSSADVVLHSLRPLKLKFTPRK